MQRLDNQSSSTSLPARKPDNFMGTEINGLELPLSSYCFFFEEYILKEELARLGLQHVIRVTF